MRYASLEMSRTITQRELRNDSGAILREVQAGQTIIITRNGMPVAELRPIPPRRFVPRAVIAGARPEAPRVDAGRLRADLDAVVDPSIDD
jgi:prevent-host-death family protein